MRPGNIASKQFQKVQMEKSGSTSKMVGQSVSVFIIQMGHMNTGK